jgi:RHS repeat-associated protein
MKFLRIVGFLLLVLVASKSFAQSFTGETEACAGIGYTYTYNDDVTYDNAVWSVSGGGTITKISGDDKRTIKWTSDGSVTVRLYRNGGVVSQDTKNVSVSEPGSISISVSNVCAGNSVTLTESGSIGDHTWIYSTDGGINWTEAGGATTFVHTPTVNTLYKYFLTDCGRNTASNERSVTVTPVSNAGTITASKTTECNSGTVTLYKEASTTGSLQWQRRYKDGAGSSWPATWYTFSTSTNSSVNHSLSVGSQDRYYQFKLVATNGICPPDESNIRTVTVYKQSDPGTLRTYDGNTFCDEATIDLQVSGAYGSRTWQQRYKNGSNPWPITWTDISESSDNSIPVNVETGSNYNRYYQFRLRTKNGTCDYQYGNTVSIQVDYKPDVRTLSATSQICNSGTVNLSLVAAPIGTISWESQYKDGADGTWSDWLPFSTTNNASTSTLVSTDGEDRYYKFRVVGANASCPNDISNVVSTTVYQSSAIGTVSFNGASEFCQIESVSLSLSSAVGIVTWEKQSKVGGGSWSGWTPLGSTNFGVGGNVEDTRYNFRAKATNGTCTTVTSNEVSAVWYAPPTVGNLSISEPSTFCESGMVNLNLASAYGTITWQKRYRDEGGTWQSWVPFDTNASNSSSTDVSSDSVDRYYEFQVTVNNGICNSVTSGTVTAFVSATTNSGTLTGDTGAFGEANGTLNLDDEIGSVLSWYSSTDLNNWDPIPNTSGETSFNYNITETTYYNVVVANGSCTSEESSIAKVQIYPIPTLTLNGTDNLAPGAQTQLITDNGFYSYEWYKDGNLITGQSNTILDINRPGSYRLKVAGDNGGPYYETADFIINSSIDNPMQDINLITTISYNVPDIAPSTSLYDLTTSDYQLKTDYFDGLGRPIQTNLLGASPAGNDIVNPMDYDDYGRTTSEYLPYATAGRNGSYLADPLIPQSTFYTESNDLIARSSSPYAVKEIEASPLNRVFEQGAPGEAWQPGGGATIKYDYQINVTDDAVKLFRMVDNQLNLNANYLSGELYKNTTTDEENHQVIEFTNKQGQTILKRVQANEAGSVWADTYYVYDDFGNLRYVLPPEAVVEIGVNTSVSHDLLNRWAFQYKYDGRNRMVEKKVPGADGVYMVYDQRDRLVLTQDGNQRLKEEWLFTKYDALNRPIITGIVGLNQLSVTEIRNQVKSHSYFYEVMGDDIFGYTNQSYPVLNDEVGCLSVTYYDNYNFHHALLPGYNFIPDQYNSLHFDRVKGQVTGGMIRVLDSDKWLRSINYYDDKYRVIQSVADNAIGGIDRVSTQYDFVGKVLNTSTYQKTPNPLVWTKHDEIIESNGVFKSITNTAWGAGVSSVNQLEAGKDGFVETTIHTLTGNRFIGFNDHDEKTKYDDMNYAVYLVGQSLRVYSELTPITIKGTVEIGDVVRLERVGELVSVYQNGDMVHEFTTEPSTTPLVIDISLTTDGGELGNINTNIPLPANEPPYGVYWTGLYYTSDADNQLVRTHGSNSWNGNASSINRLNSYEDGWFEFETIHNNKALMIGFAESDLNSDYKYIDYALYLKNNGDLAVYESYISQGSIGTYLAGDKFKIERAGGIVRFYQNDNLIYTSEKESYSNLIIDASLNTSGATLTNIKSSFTYSEPDQLNQKITRNFDYDHAGRLINTWHGIEENVTWKDLIDAEVIDETLVKKTGTSSFGTSGAFSENSIPFQVDGYLEFQVNHRNKACVVGLSEFNINEHWNTINFGIYLVSNGSLTIMENGVYGVYTGPSYDVGDILSIERSNGQIVYKKNGIIFYESLNYSENSLFADVAFQTGLGSIENTKIGLTPVQLSHNQYNELGELIDKQLHSEDEGASFAQSVDYRYNIRGWLTRINDSNLSETEAAAKEDYFGFELAYNDTWNTVGNTAMFNGNISAVKWSAGVVAGDQSAYKYDYDPMNRILGADYRKGQSDVFTASTGKFNITGLNYDLNGNIKALTRNGMDGSNMDALTYDYGTGVNRSNQLLSVGDAGNDAEGFKEGNTTGNDYAYDANGNMTKDLNKDIVNITYNHLNLPEVVEKADGQRIRYSYDAAGIKLAQHVEQGERVYSSDFSAGVDETLLTYAYLAPNIDGIGGEDDVLKVTARTLGSYHRIYRLVPVQNKRVKMSAKVYIPSSNTNVDGLKLLIGSEQTYLNPLLDSWQTIEFESYSTTDLIHIYLTAAGAQNFAGTELTDDDIIYIKDWKITAYDTKSTDYVGEYIYETEVDGARKLALIQHEEGRIIPDPINGYEYQYHLKDHLGNTRVTFTTKPNTHEFTLNYENDPNNPDDAGMFEKVQVGSIKDFNSTQGNASYSNAQVLYSSPNAQVGSVIAIPVGQGDKITAIANAKYVSAAADDPVDPMGLAAALINAFTTTASGGIDGGTNTINTNFDGGSLIGGAGFPYEDAAAPRAFLNVMFLPDGEGIDLVNNASFAYDQISNGATESPVGNEVSDSPFDELRIEDFVAPAQGYVMVYVSNEGSLTDVYFDDISITVEEHPVIQKDDYYPFGLTFNSWQRVTAKENKFKLSGKEKIDDLDLGWDDFGARMYMADIGRWGVIDPMAERYTVLTPYNYTFNNPVNIIDLDGECPTCPDDAEEGDTYNYNGIDYTFGEGGTWANGLGMTHDETWDLMSELGETIYKASDEEEKASSFSLTVTVADGGKSKLQGNASTNGDLKLYANSGASGKMWGLTLVGFAEKVGISMQDGQLKGFATSEFDLMGVNYRMNIDPISGDRTDQLGIAIKFSKGKIGITYRMKVENSYVPPHERGSAGLMGAGLMRSRMTTARVYMASKSTYQVQRAEIKRSTPSAQFIYKILKSSPQLNGQYQHKQDATQVNLTRRIY